MLLHELDDPRLGGRGVILFSGGADSTLLARALGRRGRDLIALSIDYPGRPDVERDRAEGLSRRLGMEPVRLGLDFAWPAIQGAIGAQDEGWFPHRNIMFLGLALHVAEVKKADFITAGYAKSDGIFFSDATPEFLGRFVELAKLSRGRTALTHEIDLLMPFLDKDAFYWNERERDPDLTQLIAESWSCWRNEAEPCGTCAACRERAYCFGAEPPPGLVVTRKG